MSSCHIFRELVDAPIAHSQHPLRCALSLPTIVRHQKHGHSFPAARSNEILDKACRMLVE
jgi:hypothetical protein